jgi:hypothetical protein
VERVGASVPEHRRLGRIVWVVPHKGTPEHLTEYAVDFGFGMAIYYQTELQPGRGTSSTHDSSPSHWPIPR